MTTIVNCKKLIRAFYKREMIHERLGHGLFQIQNIA